MEQVRATVEEIQADIARRNKQLELDKQNIEEMKSRMKLVPRYSYEYDKLRWNVMTQEERKRFRMESLSISQIASQYSFCEKYVLNLFNEHNVIGRRYQEGRRGKPPVFYHPSDIEPFIEDLPSKNLLGLATNKDAVRRVFRKNEHILNTFRNIIQEIDNDRAKMQ